MRRRVGETHAGMEKGLGRGGGGVSERVVGVTLSSWRNCKTGGWEGGWEGRRDRIMGESRRRKAGRGDGGPYIARSGGEGEG